MALPVAHDAAASRDPPAVPRVDIATVPVIRPDPVPLRKNETKRSGARWNKMAPHIPLSDKRPFAGQVVRPPNPTDGVGRALRHVYRQGAELPCDWEQHLRSLDDLPKQ